MEKVFLLNVGNTHTRYGMCEDGKIISSGSHDTDKLENLEIPKNTDVAVATVVPDVMKIFTKYRAYQVTTDCKTDIDLSLVEKEKLGADRFANLVALSELSELPAAVIDCGTALSVEVVNKEKQFIGGIIAPGRSLQRKTLHSYTAQLPYIEVKSGQTYKTFGCTTEDSIILGTDLGIIGATKEFLNIVKKELKVDKLNVYVTGGDSELLIKYIPEIKPVSVNFTLYGVLKLWRDNK
jgi:type III pantothenate kinase